MQKGKRSRRDAVRAQARQRTASSKYKQALIIIPAVKLAMVCALALSLLLFIQGSIESIFPNILLAQKSGQEVPIPHFPFFSYPLTMLLISPQLISKLTSGIEAYDSWHQGNS